MRKKLNRRRPVIEALESRRLLATFGVNDTGTAGDPYTLDGLCDTTNNPTADPPVGPSGICTLPAAVTSANGSVGADTIAFDIPGVGVPTIDLGLLTLGIIDTVTIDGTTQPAGMVELQGLSNNGVIQLLLGGITSSSGSRVTGLVINNSFGGIGMLSDNNTVVGNRFGTDPTGTVLMPITGTAIGISGNNNTIGGPMPQDRNIISGSLGGVSIASVPDVSAATGNVIQGNYIGTDVTGTVPFGNTIAGVDISFAASNTVVDNLISANGTGVSIRGDTATGNVVAGNLIGTDVTGLACDQDGIPDNGDELGNADDGVTIVDASLNIIGGLALEDRNLISCNVDDGISMIGMLASDNFIQGNFIGTDVNGTAPLGNFGDGVVINNAPDNAIGGAAIGAANVISSNAGDGVFINGIDATGNLVLGNFIGTNVNGTAALGNGLDGVAIQDAPGNSIGGPSLGEGNLISANSEDGVFISGADAEGNTVQGNKIGTDVTGTAALGNGIDGVGIQRAPNNTIGGPDPGQGNLISANGEDGVFITREEARGNTVQGNKIGTDVTGTAPLGNGIDGIGIDDAPDNTIGDTVGGPNPDAGNLISANGGDGVFIRGITATGNLIRGNRIGTDQAGNVPLANDDDGVEINNASDNVVTANVISGNLGNGVQLIADAAFNDINRNFIGTNDSQTACDGLGNGGDGVAIVEASFNFIGGDQVANGNVISCNAQDGVSISGQAAVSNDVTGNSIGTLLLGQAGGNGAHGIHILDGAAANEIGGAPAFPLDANTIAFNGGTGVFVDSGTGNRIRVNSIHSNGQLGIDLNAVPGPPDGVTLNDIQPDPDADTGANDLQNFPDVEFATSSEGLRVFGTLSSLPGLYELLFYANTAVDPTRFGEGERFLFAFNVLVDASGIATFDETFAVDLSGECVTATAENLETFGTSEFSECFLGLPPIVINEIDYDQPGAVDTAEFIELKNNSTSPQNLDELSIQLIDGDGGGANVYQTIELPNVELAAGDYFVICGNPSSVPNCDLNVTPDSDFIQNGSPDAVALMLGSIVLDTVSYGGDTGTPFTEGSGVGLVDDPNLNLTGISRFPDGQDTDQNNIDFSMRPVTPGATNSAGTSTTVLDVTGNGNANPFQDGILIVRFMLGQPDENLEDPALIPAGSTRTTGAEIRAFLEAAGDALDANGDGMINPFQDGILIVRFLLGQPDTNLEDPALIPAGSTRTTGAEIRAYLETLLPPSNSFAAGSGEGEGEGESVSQTPTSTTDVNGDGTVTARDALNVLNALQRGESNQDELASLDANGDGKLTAGDAIHVINRLADNSLSSQISAAVSDSPREYEASDAVDRLLSDQAFVECLL